MNSLVAIAKTELENAGSTPTGNHINTGDIRKLSAKLFREVKNKPIDYILSVCHEFLEQRTWPMGVIAFDFAYRVKNHYDENTFTIFESWLENYVRGWGDCDDFCTHAFGELISQKTYLVKNIIKWTKREEFWMRRAAAVVLFRSIYQNKYMETNPLQISDILMNDEHYLVLKGYGWMLKALSTKEPEIVFNYLLKNKAVMPRIAYRYAMQKMDAEKKKILLQEPPNKYTTGAKHMEKGKVILLGGCPRTGKTTLSVKLIKSGKRFSRISLDMLGEALNVGFPDPNDEFSNNFEFVKIILEKSLADAEIYGINTVFDFCSYDFTLENIDKLPFKDKLDMYFFGFPDITVEEIKYNIRHYSEPTDWIYHVDDDYLESVAKRIYDFNKKLKEHCEKNNYKFINTGVGEERNIALTSLYDEIIK